MKRRGLCVGLSALIWVCLGSVPLWAYDVETHKEIGLRAVNVSSMDSVLKSELALPDGKASVFNERSAEDWVREGAGLEDVPFLRVINHFHNPLRPWGQAGLFTGLASVRWQQFGSQDWSWEDARQYYKEALTSAQPQQREDAFANTFRALGQLTHLIQDATVPAHVRNDSHLLFVNDDPYEEWVEQTREENLSLFQSFLNSPPAVPPDSIFTPTGDTPASVAIARLIDSDMFDGNNAAPLTDPAIGVAEYTNGNFLSRDTIFRNFVLPRESSLGAEILVPEMTPQGQKFRRYFRKKGAGEPGGEGEPVEHFVAEGMLYNSIFAAVGHPLIGGYTLIHLVHRDYAAKLLPRAVGYSASLLNYFFRGTLNFTVSPGAGGQSVLKITNTSSERMEGKFTLYADNSSDARSQVDWFDPLILGAGASSTELSFTPPSEVKAYILVFEGKLGNPGPGSAVEEGAVVGKVQPVSCTAPVIQSHNTAIGGSNQVTIPKPAGTVQGDLLIAHMAVHDTDTAGDAVLNPPSGWTQELHTNHSNGSLVAGIWTKIAGASEPADYTWTQSNTTGIPVGAIIRITGHKSSGYIHNGRVTLVATIRVGETLASSPGVNTTKDNILLLRFLSVEGSETQAASPPPNRVELYDTESGGSPRALATMAWQNVPTPQPPDMEDFTVSGTLESNDYIGHSIAITSC